MAKDTDISRAENTPQEEPQDSNRGGISRRDLIYAGAWGAVGFTALAYFGFLLKNMVAPESDSSKPKSLDDRTDAMIDTLSKATIDDVMPLGLGVDYKDNASFDVPAVIGKYLIEYHFTVQKHEWMTITPGYSIKTNGNKLLSMKLEPGQWTFQDVGRLDENSSFSYHDHEHNEHKDFNRKYGSVASANIRDLFNIDFHIQERKGKDLTYLVDSFSEKVSSLSSEDFKVMPGTDGMFECQAKKEDFEISSYTFDEDFYGDKSKPSVKFTMSDGENKLHFYGSYEDGNINYVSLQVNSSHFKLVSGEIWDFPRKVYNKYSAIRLIEKAKAIEMHLTSIIRPLTPQLL